MIGSGGTAGNRGKAAAAGIAAGLLAIGLAIQVASQISRAHQRGLAGSDRTKHAPAAGGISFTRVNETAGIRFQHADGSSGKKYFVEAMGAGCALTDFNGDGWLDLYLVNGGPLPGYTGPKPRNQMCFNNQDGTFTDVTDQAGVGDPGYGSGCCAGDYDRDGDADLYVTNWGRSVLYRNNGNGTFTDVTARAGVAAPGYSTGAAFGDYDNDGHLDLYVCRYIRYELSKNITCFGREGNYQVPLFCRPIVYPAAPDALYHNNGDGTFTEVTRMAGMRVPAGRGLGCLWTDVNTDGFVDLYVANDMSANFLFVNQRNGTFKERARDYGCAFDDSGRAQAGMGVAAGDYDGDGRLDLIVTNFVGEYAALYRNEGGAHFYDVSAATGVIEATAPYVGFGVGWQDFDLDSWPDLFIANGHVADDVERFYEGIKLAQPSIVLRNTGQGRFLPVTDPGSAVTAPRISRGAAFGDFDHDGDVDVLVLNRRGEPDLLRNDQPAGSHWLSVRLRGKQCNRDGVGARVVVVSGGRRQVQEVYSGGSYCSQSDFRLTFGLGRERAASLVQVRWPGGTLDTLVDVPADRRIEIVQGSAPTDRAARPGHVSATKSQPNEGGIR